MPIMLKKGLKLNLEKKLKHRQIVASYNFRRHGKQHILELWQLLQVELSFSFRSALELFFYLKSFQMKFSSRVAHKIKNFLLEFVQYKWFQVHQDKNKD